MSAPPGRITISDDEEEPEQESTPVVAPPKRPRIQKPRPEPVEEEVIPPPTSSCSFCLISSLFGVLFVVFGFIIATWTLSSPLGSSSSPEGLFQVSRDRKDTRSHLALYNTTTPELVWKVRTSLQHHQKSQPSRYPCLCMHHLSLNVSTTLVRVCSVYNADMNQFYLLMNPRLIGALRADMRVPKMETSISCTVPKDRYIQRHTSVFIEWEDEQSKTHFALFRDANAYCLQLALDEFGGSEGPHCV